MAGFAGRMKDHQVKWAREDGSIPEDYLEVRHGRPSWVLKQQYRRENLYQPEWWGRIVGHEHRWARALNSSQCFAVNLFGPAATNEDIARAILRHVVGREPGGDSISDTTRVKVEFEHTPPDGPEWLGEKRSRQPTQVDVFFTASNEDWRGHLLVEVKLTENFGCCRGPKAEANPDRQRCNHGWAVARDPEASCWLADPAGEARRYWQVASGAQPSLDFRYLRDQGEPCPFSQGLYQLWRNHCLGKALVAHGARWAFVAACVHPDNDQRLKTPVAGQGHAVGAFRKLAGASACLELDPRQVINTTLSVDPRQARWAEWMCARYLLGE